MNLYVRLRTSFWTHRKTLRLQAIIGEAALWIPPKLWCYAAEKQPDGDFSDFSAAELALAIGYAGDANRMLEALQQASFLDEMRLHGWKEHNGYHSVFAARAKKAASVRWKKESNKERKAKGTREDKDKTRDKHCYKHSLSSATSIPDKLLTISGFQEEWLEFCQSRRKKGVKMSVRAAELILNRLAEQPTRAVEALQEAVMRNWTGFKWDWMESKGGSNGANHKSVAPGGRGVGTANEKRFGQYSGVGQTN